MRLNPDIALLQEAAPSPSPDYGGYQHISGTPLRRDGAEQRFRSVMLVRGRIIDRISLHGSQTPGIVPKLVAGNTLGAVVELARGGTVRVINMYIPPWTTLRPDGRRVWMHDEVLESLRRFGRFVDLPWVIGGDLNLSETFDLRSKKPRGNKAFLDAMAACGLTDCLRHSQGRLVPTYRHRSGSVEHQIDHLFVNGTMLDRLQSCNTLAESAVFDARPRLSDHLPIVADFSDARPSYS
jgi:endonuclease/exonuclease/phosphatase family metal-dependent hydrolase